MRPLVLPALLLAAAFGYQKVAAAPQPREEHGYATMALEGAFKRTQNLRGGEGLRRPGQPRRPGIPAAFRDAGPKRTQTDRDGEGRTQITTKAYRSDLRFAADGSGDVRARGEAPCGTHYTLEGHWETGNVGTWIQRWTRADGNAEQDLYRTHGDGSATLRTTTDRGLTLDLRFAADGSGRGTATDRKGVASLVWDAQGDGTVTWADGTITPYEDWTL